VEVSRKYFDLDLGIPQLTEPLFGHREVYHHILDISLLSGV